MGPEQEKLINDNFTDLMNEVEQIRQREENENENESAMSDTGFSIYRFLEEHGIDSSEAHSEITRIAWQARKDGERYVWQLVLCGASVIGTILLFIGAFMFLRS